MIEKPFSATSDLQQMTHLPDQEGDTTQRQQNLEWTEEENGTTPISKREYTIEEATPLEGDSKGDDAVADKPSGQSKDESSGEDDRQSLEDDKGTDQEEGEGKYPTESSKMHQRETLNDVDSQKMWLLDSNGEENRFGIAVSNVDGSRESSSQRHHKYLQDKSQESQNDQQISESD